MELRQRIRNLREAFGRRRPDAPEDPYTEALRVHSHLDMLRRSVAGEATKAGWYR
jgi:hypothetical protein